MHKTDRTIQETDLYRIMPVYSAPVYGTAGATKNKLQSFKITIPKDAPKGLQIVVYATNTATYYKNPPYSYTDPTTNTEVDVPGEHIIRVIPITPGTPEVVNVNIAPAFTHVYVRTRIPGQFETPGCPIAPVSNVPPPVIPP